MTKKKKIKNKNLSNLQNEYFFKLISSVVRVDCKKKTGETSIGTGFIVDNGRFAVTAFHVVENADKIKVVRYHAVRDDVEINTKDYPREVEVDNWTGGSYLVGEKKDSIEPNKNINADGSFLNEIPPSGTETLWKIDISILHLKETFNNISPIEIDTKPASTGDDVFFIGYPNAGLKFETYVDSFYPVPLLSKAIISFGMVYGTPPVVEYYYWLDRPSFPGISGAPVLSLKTGKVIGVVSAVPFMPKQIQTGNGTINVSIPDGYSIVYGTSMIPGSIEHTKKRMGVVS